MANTLRFKRGLASGLPTGLAGEPLFTTDTFDLYIGNGTGNTRFQKFIASGTTSQLLRGDGSLLTMPIVLTSPSNGQVLKYDGTNWVNSADTGITTLNTLTALTQTFATGTSGTDFAISSAGSTHTFNIPTASATNRGLLSSADWTTFNNKQNALTNPVTGTGASGQVAYWSGTNTQTGSNYLFLDATNNRLGIGTNVPDNRLQVVTNGAKSTIAIGNQLIGTYPQLLLYGGLNKYNWSVGAQYNVNNAFEITPSTAIDGTTFSTPAITIFSNGNFGVNRTTDNGLRFQVTGDGYFSGSVGIGVSPSVKLQVNNEISTTYSSANTLAGGVIAYIKNTSTTNSTDATIRLEATGSGDLGAASISAIHAGNGFSSLTFGTRASASNVTERMRLDPLGNLELGVVPSAWGYGGNIELIGAGRYITSKSDDNRFASNVYNDGSVEKYASDGFATRYRQANGVHSWSTAASGSANAAITFTQAMTLDASGRLGIGTTSPQSKTHISFQADFDGIRLQNSVRGHNYLLTTAGSSAEYFSIYDIDNSQYLYQVSNNSGHGFLTGGVARMAITSAGNVGIGTTSPSEKLHISNTAGTGSFIRFQDTSGGGVYIGGRAERMEFYAGNAEAMRIHAATRNLSIGNPVTDTGEKLQVDGTMRVSGVSSHGNDINIFNTSTTGKIYINGGQTSARQYLIQNAITGITNAGIEIRDVTGGFTPFGIAASGAATFSSSVTTGSPITIQAAAPFIEWKNVASTRLGYIQHNATNLVYNADTGVHVFNQAATFSSSVTANGNGTTNSAFIANNQSASGAQHYIDFTAGATTIGRILRGNGAAGLPGNGINIDSYEGFQIRINQLGGSVGTFNFTGGAATFSSSVTANGGFIAGTGVLSSDVSMLFKTDTGDFSLINQRASHSFGIYDNLNTRYNLNFSSTGAATFSSTIQATGVSKLINTAGNAALVSQVGHIEFYKDATPSYAVSVGMAVPGGSITNDYIISTYSGSWAERFRIATSGAATFSSSVTAGENIGWGGVSPTGNAGISHTIESSNGSQIASRISVPQLYISSNVSGTPYAPTRAVAGYATQLALDSFGGTISFNRAVTSSAGSAITWLSNLGFDNTGAATFGSSIQAATAIAIGTTPDTNLPFKILKNINSTVGIRFENTSTGASSFTGYQFGTDVSGGTAFTNFLYASSGVAETGVYKPNGTALINTGSGGLNFLAVSQPIRFFTSTGTGTLRAEIANDGFINHYTGTPPTTNLTDGYRQYSDDITAGNAAPHFRTENGGIIKLYQQTTGVTSATYIGGAGTGLTDSDTFDGYTIAQIVKALRNAGLLA